MLKNKLIELLKVKSIITILVFGVFCYLSIIGKVDAQQFMLVLSMVATYYFSKKDNKEGA
jgi:thioredoxin-related protein